jgi:DNA-binding Lrp family transcriptional regulator
LGRRRPHHVCLHVPPERDLSLDRNGERVEGSTIFPAGVPPMKAFFVQIKCELGKAYQVATAIADAEIASEIYSTAGDYDLLAKFYLEPDADIGHFVNEKVHKIKGIRDTYTIITFRAF